MGRNVSWTLLAILLLGFICHLSAFNINARAQVSRRIYLEPSQNIFYSNETSVETRFNVTVWCEVESGVDIGGAQIYLEFNDSIINVTRWICPHGDPYFFMPEPPPATELPASPDPGYVHVAPGKGYIKISVSKGGLPPQPPWGHSGKIAIIEFKITAAPPEDGQLTCPLRINASDTYLLDPDANEISDVVKEDGSYTFIYVAAPVMPHIWLETSPTSYEAIKMRPFNVSIIIRNVSSLDGLIGVQLILTYNSTYLEVVDVIEGDFLKNYAPYGTIVTYYVNHRGLIYGQMILPNSTGYWNPPYPEGNGTIAIVTFMPLKHEIANFNITIEPLFGEFFLNKDGEYISYSPAKYCQYSYSPLLIPTIAVSPDKYISSHVGETFDINVRILNLDERWNLTYAEFTLTYNSASLQIVNVTEGPFLKQFGSTVFNYDIGDGYVRINITLTPTSGHPFGSGTLATIRFNVTSRPPATSPLILNNVLLLDPEGFEVLYELSHGYYEMHEYLVHTVVVDGVTYRITTLSNGSVSPVILDVHHRLLKFNVEGIDGTVSFVNITIPKALMWVVDGWLVIVGGEEVEPIITANATHTTLFFIVSHSSKTVYIIATHIVPEYTPFTFLAIPFIAIPLLAAARRRLKRKNPNS